MHAKYTAIKTDKLHIEELQERFKLQESFKTEDIVLFYKQFEPDLPKSTVNWRTYTLVQKGIIERIAKGRFKIGQGLTFTPEVTSQQKTIYKNLQKRFPHSRFCIWNTNVLNEFSQHQSIVSFTLIEVEKDSLQSFFYELKEIKSNVFLEPSTEIIENYILPIKNPIIIKSLKSEAPIQSIGKISVPTIEKILADLFCDKEFFFFYQGKELKNIFQEAFSKYTINQTKLLRYCNRRGKKAELETYLIKNQFDNTYQIRQKHSGEV